MLIWFTHMLDFELCLVWCVFLLPNTDGVKPTNFSLSGVHLLKDVFFFSFVLNGATQDRIVIVSLKCWGVFTHDCIHARLVSYHLALGFGTFARKLWYTLGLRNY